MVVVWGFGFFHSDDREVERERERGGRKRDKNERKERYYYCKYILLSRYIILICY